MHLTKAFSTVLLALAIGAAATGCGRNASQDEDARSSTTTSAARPDDAAGVVRGFTTEYERSISVDEGFDLASGDATLSSLVSEGEWSAAGVLVGVRDDLAVEYGPDDREQLLTFQMETDGDAAEGAPATTYLTMPVSPLVSVAELDAMLQDQRPPAFASGERLVVPDGAKLISSTGQEVPADVLTVPTVFPLVVGIDGPTVATSITSTMAIPATEPNLAPLRSAGLSVERFGNSAGG